MATAFPEEHVTSPRTPITFTRSGAVPPILLAALFVAYSRHGTTAGIVAAALVGAGGGAASLLIHELGHASAARKTLGVTPIRISLLVLGASTHLKGSFRSGRDQIRVALAGPLASFALAIPLMLVLATPAPTALKFAFFLLSLLNVGIGVVSLLPFAPLDGYKVLVGLVWSRVGSEQRARALICRVGLLFVAVDVFAVCALLVERPTIGACVALVVATAACERRLAMRFGRRGTPDFAGQDIDDG